MRFYTYISGNMQQVLWKWLVGLLQHKITTKNKIIFYYYYVKDVNTLTSSPTVIKTGPTSQKDV